MSEDIRVIFVVSLFLLTYALIVAEVINRTTTALAAASILLTTSVLSIEEALEAIDFNTIVLLVGMMVIVGIAKQTGLFEFLAIKSAKMAGGEPLKIMTSLSLVTAVLSALLDNVTTVLLIVPVTFAIARRIEANPLPFIIVEIIASNIGGTATLIGDPPNIMIGGATGLGFMDFVLNLTPVVVIIYLLTIFILKVIFRKQFKHNPHLRDQIMSLEEKEEIKDPVLLKKSLLVLFLTTAGFGVHQYVHLESSVIALAGAVLLLLLSREDPEHAFQAVEWPVIFFFAGLFVLVGALEKAGVIEILASLALDYTGGQVLLTGMIILWVAAIASALVDNIPFVAAMIPLVQDMGRLGGIENINFLWWSLSLGACLGGNGTIVGASANVVAVGMSEKRGTPISFLGFMAIGFPLMIMSVIIATGYLFVWYQYPGLLSRAGTLGVALLIYLALRAASRR